MYAHYQEKLGSLVAEDPTLHWYFLNSIFPATTVNFGPDSICWDHLDTGNYAAGWCAIWGMGPYDCTKGGHLILFDIKKIVRFPPGSLILIPSALMRHGNTPIQAGDQRLSLTQYAAGGLFRWVANGFCKAVEADSEVRGKVDRESDMRYENLLSLYSKFDQLSSDRAAVFSQK